VDLCQFLQFQAPLLKTFWQRFCDDVDAKQSQDVIAFSYSPQHKCVPARHDEIQQTHLWLLVHVKAIF